MNKPRPENLDLSLQSALHLVHSEPILTKAGATTPTIKLSSAYDYSTGCANERDSIGKVVSSPVILSAADLERGHDSTLGLSNGLPGPESSDLSPSDPNGNADYTTSEAPEKLSVVSSSINFPSSLKTSLSSSLSSAGNCDLLSLLPIKTRFATLSISDSLMPPEALAFNSKRHNSLPIPGTTDHLTPAHALDNGRANGKSHRNGNGVFSVSQPSSPVHKKKQSTWSRMFGGKPKASTAGTDYSSAGENSDASCFSFNSQDEEHIGTSPKQRLQSLVKTVRSKIRKVGNNQVAPAPQNLLAPPPPQVSTRKRLDSFAPSSVATDDEADEIHFKGMPCCRKDCFFGFLNKLRPPAAIDPLGHMWLSWLFIVALAYIYNAIVIFLRCSFPVQTSSNFGYWFFCDYLFDAIYIADILLRMRLIYFDCGLVVLDEKLMRKQYFRTKNFKMDLISLIPLDIFYLVTGVLASPEEVAKQAASAAILLRLPRLLKVHSYVEFVEKFENRTTYPNIFRVVQSVGYLLYITHLNTCCYYVVSVWEGIAVNSWVYNGNGVAYIRCLYRAAKTLITIGQLPPPVTTFEIFFMNMDFLIGIFVFATIIGQMRDIVGNAGATRGEFRRRMDNTMALLKRWKIPKDIQNRVRLWYMYSWDRKELVDELEAIKGVPIKMQTDLAIHVHMGTLSKVSLFRDCDKMLLRDLVLKLRPVLYLPGDYICRKGEVGKEMYIIKSGCVQVLGGENNRTVLATLHSGSYFGEISLLSVGVGNRRTADVYSPGYANLFLLDKKTLQEVVVNYPDAQESLKKKAREILKKNQAQENLNKKKRGKSLIAESILKKGPDGERSPGKFFNTVLAAARNQKLSSTILKGSFRATNSMGSEGSLAHFSASDFSSDDDLLNNPPKRRRFRRKKDRRRSKSAQPISTNADIHAAHSDSDALSAAEKGVYDNKGYISTEVSSAVEDKKGQTSTEEAIADIMTDSETKKASFEEEEKDKKEKKPTLQKQVHVEETENDFDLESKMTPLETFSFDDSMWSSRDMDDKSDDLVSGRQFTFDERDEDAIYTHPLRQFTFDEVDEMIKEEQVDTVAPLKQFDTFDEMAELVEEEDMPLPPLRQFTFDDSADSEAELIEETVRKMSRDATRPSKPEPPSKDAIASQASKEGAAKDKDGATEGNNEADQASKPKLNTGHAERIRTRPLRGKSQKGSVKRLQSKDRTGKKGKKRLNLESAKSGDSLLSQDLSLSFTDTDGGTGTDEDKKEEKGEVKKPKRRVGMVRRLPPISIDQLDEGSIDKEEEEGKEKNGLKENRDNNDM